jgi:amino acid transporter
MPALHLRRSQHPAVTRALDEQASGKRARTLGVSSIALISLAAVLTLRSLPSIAEDGWSSIAYYLLGAILFFIPLALVAAELATGWPRAGGLYAWVKEAFGDRSGFSRSGLNGSRTSSGFRRCCRSWPRPSRM